MSISTKTILLAASWSGIEPLGLLHLAAVARESGWCPRIFLARKPDCSDLLDAVITERPDLVGYTVYTGNHTAVLPVLDHVRARHRIPVVVGGPHATFFPADCLPHADFVVIGEGFASLRRILSGQVATGLVPFETSEPIPRAERSEFYRDYPELRASPIKSVIARTGCPFACSYCYNSSDLSSLQGHIPEATFAALENSLGAHGRLFADNRRTPDEVIDEVAHILSVAPETKMIFFQDDVFGADSSWLRNFSRGFSTFRMEFHAQMRFEYVDPRRDACRERTELLRAAGCTGLTLAIESADPVVRSELLNRPMDDDLILRVMRHLAKFGFRVRTEQMLGLPCGATSRTTAVNLEADLATLRLNVRIRQETGLPTTAWASIFVPYPGTRLGSYAIKHGFYTGDLNDVPPSFFDRSVLRFPRRWLGPMLSATTPGAWLPDDEQERHRHRVKALRDIFEMCARLPEGDELAAKFLAGNDLSLSSFSTFLRRHVYEHELYGVANR